MNLLRVQFDEDRGFGLWVLVFVVLPILARLVRWIATRAGLVKPEAQGEPRAESARERMRRRREERRQAEAEGEDLWKRLARGETIESPPVPVPSTGSGRQVSLEREASLERDLAPEPGEVESASLEREEEPAPLSVLGEVREPAEAPESSLESPLEPAPLATLERPGALAPLPSGPSGRRRRPGARIGRLARDDWRRAIVLAEVLGPPVSERRPA